VLFHVGPTGNKTTLIWLEKQNLEQSNRQEVKSALDELADLLAEFRNGHLSDADRRRHTKA
jgi:hypothetical protein